jgi:hypothetical protein
MPTYAAERWRQGTESRWPLSVHRGLVDSEGALSKLINRSGVKRIRAHLYALR